MDSSSWPLADASIPTSLLPATNNGMRPWPLTAFKRGGPRPNWPVPDPRASASSLPLSDHEPLQSTPRLIHSRGCKFRYQVSRPYGSSSRLTSPPSSLTLSGPNQLLLIWDPTYIRPPPSLFNNKFPQLPCVIENGDRLSLRDWFKTTSSGSGGPREIAIPTHLIPAGAPAHSSPCQSVISVTSVVLVRLLSPEVPRCRRYGVRPHHRTAATVTTRRAGTMMTQRRACMTAA